MKEAESCWEPIKKDMYEKLCIIYQSIVNEIFKGIESVAVDSLKTPADVVRFQNYHHMTRMIEHFPTLFSPNLLINPLFLYRYYEEYKWP